MGAGQRHDCPRRGPTDTGACRRVAAQGGAPVLTIDLPPPLQAAIDEELAGHTARDLAAASAAVSGDYASGRASALADGARHAAYLAARLPATYAAVSAALARAPYGAFGGCRSLLDLGAGPGTATWATLAHCAGITDVTQVDRSPALLAIAARLAVGGALEGRDVTLTQRVADIGASDSWPSSDVVVGAYALAELSPAARPRVVAAAWRATARVLVLVEPGTPAGFGHIHEARAALIAAGAHVLAPCPHEGPCPMRTVESSGDWCHFAVRVPRTRRHRLVKGGTLGYEDEKYAYLVVAREAHPERAEARVLRHPRIEKGRIALALCTPDGAQRLIVTRRDATWRAARKVDWGDPWGTAPDS